MDYWGIVVESWRVARSERSLWPLGAVLGVSSLVGACAVTVAIVPLAFAAIMAGSTSLPRLAAETASAFLVFRQHMSPWVLACLALVVFWVVTGIYSVAATGGIISQVEALQAGGSANTWVGFSDGFTRWWRVAGLLALAAIPTLVLLLLHALAFFTAFTVPTMRGAAPNLALLSATTGLLSPLDTLASLAAVPLAVLVQLALRFGVIDGLEWKPAFGAAWRLARAALGEVVLMYIAVLVASLAVVTVLAVALGLVVGVFAAAAVAAALSRAFALAIGIAVVALLVAALLGVAGSAVLAPFASALWTLFWRGATRRDLRFVIPTYAPTVGGEVST